MRAGIIVTGTEVLTGRTSDRNGPWVSERLAEQGVEVAHITVVGDRAEDLEATLRFLSEQGMELIITTGGLGPTADDITTEVVAAFVGRDLVLDEDMEERITAIIDEFAKRMKFDPEGVKAGTRKQAMIPAGSIPLDPVGTAPGVVVPGSETTIVVLPGPPRELQGMWPAALATEAVASIIASAPSLRIASMKMFGVPESTLAKSLREIGDEIDIGRLEITTCLRRGAELEIDVSYEDGQEQLREALFDGLRERHGGFIYTETGESIDELVATALAGRSLALAESCSAGLLAARITDRPGSSAYFAGGVVAYSDRAKSELLGVDPALIDSLGAVSPEVAEAMADGALERFGADIAVGVTGIAGPGGGSEEKPVGYVCICVKDHDGQVLARDPKLPGGRGDVRDRSVAVSLHMLRRLLLGGELPI